MSLNLDMKEIERKAYTTYHEDGLLDITIGVVFLGWGLAIAINPAGLIFLLGPIALGIWYLGKKYITIPRVGVIKPISKISDRMRNLAIFLLVLGVITFSAIVLMIASDDGAISEHALSILGLVVASGISVIGYVLNLKRLYIYAVGLFVAFTVGEALNSTASAIDYFILSVILSGTLILISGIIFLVRFIRKYPVPVIEA